MWDYTAVSSVNRTSPFSARHRKATLASFQQPSPRRRPRTTRNNIANPAPSAPPVRTEPGRLRRCAQRRRPELVGIGTQLELGGGPVHAGQHHDDREPDGPRHQRRRSRSATAPTDTLRPNGQSGRGFIVVKRRRVNGHLNLSVSAPRWRRSSQQGTQGNISTTDAHRRYPGGFFQVKMEPNALDRNGCSPSTARAASSGPGDVDPADGTTASSTPHRAAPPPTVGRVPAVTEFNLTFRRHITAPARQDTSGRYNNATSTTFRTFTPPRPDGTGQHWNVHDTGTTSICRRRGIALDGFGNPTTPYTTITLPAHRRSGASRRRPPPIFHHGRCPPAPARDGCVLTCPSPASPSTSGAHENGSSFAAVTA